MLDLVGGLVSGFLGYKAQKDQKRMQKKQLGMQQQEIGLQREGLEWGKEKYADWEARFNPTFNRMMNELDQDLEPNYGMIAGDVKSGFQSARGQERRNMRRYGIRPTDGASRSMEREYGIREAAAHVGARSSARESKRGLKYGRLADATNMLVGMQGTPANMVNSGYGRTGNAMAGMAGTYGGIGEQRYLAGMDNAAGWGTFIGGTDWGGIWNNVKGWFNDGGSSGGGAGGGGIG